MEDDLKELVSRLKIAHSGALLSVIAYGSAIAAPGNVHKTDYHILVVTRTLSAEDLRTARPVAKWWVERGYLIPVYFMRDEFLQSLDVFAIEFRHMKRAYQVLFGEDLLGPHEASNANLRLQTEYELRGKLLRLRSLYLPASGSVETLTKLMTDSIYSFSQFMRPLLELSGEEPPLSRLATVRRVGERFQIDMSAPEQVLRLREVETLLTETEANELFARYLDCLTQVVATVNRL
ncbi:MAG TPA: hypothetical protein VFZ34_17110 [Blastocatellia bacterium]|nr:hypothetical protein [Blastocatellia bacterium]